MLKVAIDESGTHDNAPCISVAACIAEHASWKQFERDWKPRAANYPKGYHATNARFNDNTFLAGVVARWLTGFAVTIAYDDFKEVVPHRLKSAFGAEYVTALRVIALVLRYYCEQNEIRWMNWVLERGHREQKAADKTLYWMEDRPQWRIYGHQWLGKEDITCHAADILAYSAAASYNGGGSPFMEQMADTSVVRHFDRDELKEAVRKGKLTLSREAWLKQQLKTQ